MPIIGLVILFGALTAYGTEVVVHTGYENGLQEKAAGKPFDFMEANFGPIQFPDLDRNPDPTLQTYP